MAQPPKTFSTGGIVFSGVYVCEWVFVSWKPCEHHTSKTNEENFTRFWSQMYLGSYVLIKFWGQKVKVTTREGITVDGSPLSYIKLEMFCGFPFKCHWTYLLYHKFFAWVLLYHNIWQAWVVLWAQRRYNLFICINYCSSCVLTITVGSWRLSSKVPVMCRFLKSKLMFMATLHTVCGILSQWISKVYVNDDLWMIQAHNISLSFSLSVILVNKRVGNGGRDIFLHEVDDA